MDQPMSPAVRWPGGATAAVCITMDNMGEAADLNRRLWPTSEPIGHHYSVRKALPQMLNLLTSNALPATYFIESWNLGVYGETIVKLPGAGIEVAWHAWQHEAWAKLGNEREERENFERSFRGQGGVATFAQAHPGSGVEVYRGFRPPGGVIHRDRTLALCREFGLEYLSPAAQNAAVVPVQHSPGGQLVILPFRWAAVDAYYYMDSFAPLREIKGEISGAPLSPQVLAERYIGLIRETIASGGYLSVLFHPFLTNTVERLDAMKEVLEFIAARVRTGELWVARNEDIAAWIKHRPGTVGDDPVWDTTQWR